MEASAGNVDHAPCGHWDEVKKEALPLRWSDVSIDSESSYIRIVDSKECGRYSIRLAHRNLSRSSQELARIYRTDRTQRPERNALARPIGGSKRNYQAALDSSSELSFSSAPNSLPANANSTLAGYKT